MKEKFEIENNVRIKVNSLPNGTFPEPSDQIPPVIPSSLRKTRRNMVIEGQPASKVCHCKFDNNEAREARVSGG